MVHAVTGVQWILLSSPHSMHADIRKATIIEIPYSNANIADYCIAGVRVDSPDQDAGLLYS